MQVIPQFADNINPPMEVQTSTQEAGWREARLNRKKRVMSTKKTRTSRKSAHEGMIELNYQEILFL